MYRQATVAAAGAHTANKLYCKLDLLLYQATVRSFEVMHVLPEPLTVNKAVKLASMVA